jgi:hypothetical protein
METKLFQVRDEGTHIPVMATHVLVTMEDRELRRAGFAVGRRYTLLTNLATMTTQYDEERWTPGRTMRLAHLHLNEMFDIYKSGAVIDIEYILGQREAPREPE